mgnify:CR=1 FL=1
MQFGGHHQAAGLTVKTANIEEFKRQFRAEVARTLKPEDYLPVLNVDLLVDKDYVLDVPLLNELKLLEPYGSSNPAPLFAFKGAAVRYAKFSVRKYASAFFCFVRRAAYQCLMWGGAENYPCMYNGAEADWCLCRKLNVWQDKENVNLQVVDFAQKLAIYDYRHEEINKQAFVKKLLQTESDILIYVNDKNAFLENTDIDAAFVREYGSSEAARTVVLYDLPECDVAGFAASLKKAALVAVYFCCIIMLITIMRLKRCSGAAPTVCIWRKPIKNGLPPETRVIADEAVLIAECGMEEIYLNGV